MWMWQERTRTTCIAPNLEPLDDLFPHPFSPTSSICLPSVSPHVPLLLHLSWRCNMSSAVVDVNSDCCFPPLPTVTIHHFVQSSRLHPSLLSSLFIYQQADVICGGDGADAALMRISVTHHLSFYTFHSLALSLFLMLIYGEEGEAWELAFANVILWCWTSHHLRPTEFISWWRANQLLSLKVYNVRLYNERKKLFMELLYKRILLPLILIDESLFTWPQDETNQTNNWCLNKPPMLPQEKTQLSELNNTFNIFTSCVL